MRGGLFGGETVEIACTVEIENTPDSFHAYSIPEGIEIQPGDQVLIHDAPTDIQFGDRISVERRATVVRAGWLLRTWTQIASMLELTELYEVGFSPKETP